MTERDRSMYKTETALTRNSRRSRSAGITGHLRPESSVILSGIRNRGLIDPRKRQRVQCRRLNRLQPDDEAMAKNAYRLCNARQFGPIVRVEQATDFLFIDAETLRELGLTDAGLAHRNV